MAVSIDTDNLLYTQLINNLKAQVLTHLMKNSSEKQLRTQVTSNYHDSYVSIPSTNSTLNYTATLGQGLLVSLNFSDFSKLFQIR